MQRMNTFRNSQHFKWFAYLNSVFFIANFNIKQINPRLFCGLYSDHFSLSLAKGFQ